MTTDWTGGAENISELVRRTLEDTVEAGETIRAQEPSADRQESEQEEESQREVERDRILAHHIHSGRKAQVEAWLGGEDNEVFSSQPGDFSENIEEIEVAGAAGAENSGNSSLVLVGESALPGRPITRSAYPVDDSGPIFTICLPIDTDSLQGAAGNSPDSGLQLPSILSDDSRLCVDKITRDPWTRNIARDLFIKAVLLEKKNSPWAAPTTAWLCVVEHLITWGLVNNLASAEETWRRVFLRASFNSLFRSVNISSLKQKLDHIRRSLHEAHGPLDDTAEQLENKE